MRRVLLPVLFLCLLAHFVSKPARADQLKTLSDDIRTTLQELKVQSSNLQTELTVTMTQLQEQSKALKLSETERLELVRTSTNLRNSLNDMIGQSVKWYESSENYKAQLSISRGRNIILGMVLLVLILMKIAGYVIYAWGIHLPRWLDILL